MREGGSSGESQLKAMGLHSLGWQHAKMLTAALLHQPVSWAHYVGLGAAPGGALPFLILCQV